MPEVGQHADEQRRPTVRDEQPAGGISGFGVASAILAVIALAAAGLIAVTWSAHRSAAGGPAGLHTCLGHHVSSTERSDCWNLAL